MRSSKAFWMASTGIISSLRRPHSSDAARPDELALSAAGRLRSSHASRRLLACAGHFGAGCVAGRVVGRDLDFFGPSQSEQMGGEPGIGVHTSPRLSDLPLLAQ